MIWSCRKYFTMQACFRVFETVENGGGQARNRLGFQAAVCSRRELAVGGTGWRRRRSRIMMGGNRMVCEGLPDRDRNIVT